MKSLIDWACFRLVLIWPLRWSVQENRFFMWMLPRAGDCAYRDHWKDESENSA